MNNAEARARILNIDDDDAARYAKSRILQVAGFDVIDAATGTEALSLAKEVLPDLILLDAKLPDINGLEVCKRIKSDPATSSILVLQTSAALVESNDKVRALEGGADNYLVAPIEAEELVANVNALLRLRQTQQALMESRRRLLALTKATTDVIFSMNADWSLMKQLDGRGLLTNSTEGNPNWMADYIPEGEQSYVKSIIRQAIQNESIFDLEHQVNLADGSTGWTHSRAIPIFDSGGALLEWFGVASDVTERHQYAENIRRADQRIQLALDAGAIAGTWFWDVKEDRITADSRFARSFGMDPQVLQKGVPLAQAVQSIHPEDEPRVQALIAEVVRKGGPYRVEYRALQADGHYRWIEANGHVMTDARGDATSFPGVLVDIHQRKLAEIRQAALLQLGERLRWLDKPDEIAFAASEIVGRTLGLSRAGYGIVDPLRETVKVLCDWSTDAGSPSVVGHHRFGDYVSHINDLKQGKAISVVDIRCDSRTADSHNTWLTLNIVAFLNVPLMDTNGLAAVFLAHQDQPRVWTSDDINFIKGVADRTWAAIAKAEATQALRRMNENLELLAAERTADRNRLWQLTNDLMLVAEFSGVITAINPAWEQLLGWTEDDLIGSNFFELVHPDDISRTIGAAKGIGISGLRVRGFENRYRHRDGSYRWIGWAAGPGEGFIVAVGHDMTEEKQQAEALLRAEEQLRQSQKMEAVGQLTGGLAHDFNNLLVGISGNLEMISILISQGRLDDLQRFIQSAQDSSARAASLTHRLLAFSRRQTLVPKPTNANRLIEGMKELIRHTIGPSILLETQTAPDLWPIFIDPPQLETALLNLCINARDAMPDGGHLKIVTKNEWIEATDAACYGLQPGPYVHLCVSDTGTGIPPEVIAKVFDPFFTTKPIGQGTGLGLSMVYGFARQSDGDVHIQSIVGMGTSMSIYLPQHHADEVLEKETSSLLSPVRAKVQRSVMVVDDEPAVRLSITELLKEVGYLVQGAATGPEALKMLQSDPGIDLLVTDVGLAGGMNGRQLADAACTYRPELKVLFITGYAEATVSGKEQLPPGMQIMVKPFSLEKLATRVSEILVNA